MAKFDRKEYKHLKRWAKANGVVTFAKDMTGSWTTSHNGVSVAYCLATDSPDCRMAYVAVSYCAPEDEFKNKKGKREAIVKFMNGERIQLPIGQELLDMGPKSEEAKKYIADLLAI